MWIYDYLPVLIFAFLTFILVLLNFICSFNFLNNYLQISKKIHVGEEFQAFIPDLTYTGVYLSQNYDMHNYIKLEKSISCRFFKYIYFLSI